MKVALIRDLSCGGVKFSCNQRVINNIFSENEAPLGVVLDTYVEILFKLQPEDKGTAVIKTGARVIHTERLAQDLFQVGVQFINLNQAMTQKLESFIEASRQK